MQNRILSLKNLKSGSNIINPCLLDFNPQSPKICYVVSYDANTHGNSRIKYMFIFNMLMQNCANCTLSSNTTKKGCLVSELLLKIDSIISFIHTICDSISPREHLDDILEGLPQEYESTTSLICENFGCIFIEVETLLLGHEARLDRFKKLAPSTNPPPDHNTKPTSSDSDDIVHEAC